MTAPVFCCRLCGGADAQLILSLGRMPLANALLTEEQLGKPEPVYPLDLVHCPRCALVQILATVPPEELFSDYLYFTSYSETMLRHAREIALRLLEERRLGPSSLVVELASNDGYLLKNFVAEGVPVLGIEPAANVAHVAEEQGVPTLCRFFGAEAARELRAQGRAADVVIANNVLAHVPDLNGFVEGIRTLLKPEGVAVVEVPYVKDMVERCAFDTIYHEHLCYFSVTALDRLFGRHGLALADVERVSVHGGSLRLFVQPASERSADVASARVRDLLREEAGWGAERPDFYLDFGRKVERLRDDLRALLGSLKRNGKRLAAYGASAKGTVLLNYSGVGREYLDFVADQSPHKQGRYVPGVRLPICPASRLLEDMADYALLLVWNIRDEILAQEAEYQRRGGRFITPVPEVRILNGFATGAGGRG